MVDAEGRPVELHLVMDNYAAHTHKNVRDWLGKDPRFKVHFTPTRASWMNLVEVWLGIVERQAIRHGVFKSAKDLNTKIRTFIDGWNARSHPLRRSVRTRRLIVGGLASIGLAQQSGDSSRR